jgi:hypothetical protein
LKRPEKGQGGQLPVVDATEIEIAGHLYRGRLVTPTIDGCDLPHVDAWCARGDEYGPSARAFVTDDTRSTRCTRAGTTVDIPVA